MHLAAFKTTSGAFVGPPAAEKLMGAEFMLADGSTDLVSLFPAYDASDENETPAITEESNHPSPPNVLGAVASAANGGSDLAKWLLMDRNNYSTPATNVRFTQGTPTKMQQFINDMAAFRYSWESTHFQATSKNNTAVRASAASKALLAAVEAESPITASSTPFAVRLLLGHYSQWSLSGLILEDDSANSVRGSWIDTDPP